jgi:[ribosomal protein S5]-alanine N-acetyltransferase
MNILTKRLTILPLSVAQLELLLTDRELLHAQLELEPPKIMFDENTQEAMKWLLEQSHKNPTQYLWTTSWQIIANDINAIVGSACFKGAPDKCGEVEIGYGIDEQYRCKGYMTEAAAAMCQWALKQNGVASVIAETEHFNTASQQVLTHCGMKPYKTSPYGVFWRVKNQI